MLTEYSGSGPVLWFFPKLSLKLEKKEILLVYASRASDFAYKPDPLRIASNWDLAGIYFPAILGHMLSWLGNPECRHENSYIQRKPTPEIAT